MRGNVNNITHRAAWVLLASALTASAAAHAQDRKKPPEGARLYVISPTAGATVNSPVTIRFGLSGMGVAPAGVAKEKTGHHHVLIDTDLSQLNLNQPLPATDKVRHFGGGQTEATLDLAPGRHTLQLVLGDENHVPFDPPVISEKLSITVK